MADDMYVARIRALYRQDKGSQMASRKMDWLIRRRKAGNPEDRKWKSKVASSLSECKYDVGEAARTLSEFLAPPPEGIVVLPEDMPSAQPVNEAGAPEASQVAPSQNSSPTGPAAKRVRVDGPVAETTRSQLRQREMTLKAELADFHNSDAVELTTARQAVQDLRVEEGEAGIHAFAVGDTVEAFALVSTGLKYNGRRGVVVKLEEEGREKDANGVGSGRVIVQFKKGGLQALYPWNLFRILDWLPEGVDDPPPLPPLLKGMEVKEI
eukprot:Hpha_TRINITY_DN35663_c0_g1::TRINITY_DN35663_c0_g1_i1::g.68635::m.68635